MRFKKQSKLAVPIVALLVLLISLNTAGAISCVAPGSPQEELEKSEGVFVGKVVKISSYTEHDIVEFELSSIFKEAPTLGLSLESNKVIVRTGGKLSLANYKFEEGKEYLVYANNFEEDLTLDLSICTRTKLLSEADEDIKELEQYRNDVNQANPPANNGRENIFVRFAIWLKNLFN